MHKNYLNWTRSETEAEINTMLDTLSEEYPVSEGNDGIAVKFVHSNIPESLKVSSPHNGEVTIEYGSLAAAARGVAHALAGELIEENSSFSTLGIMLDCSRNAVMTVPYLKKWLRRLSLLGYNMVMLYTEDTYRLPDEPYFGYMRGGYTLEEMQEVDDYAAKLGIEMVACIQTLGHLEHVIRWDAYHDIKDTDRVLLVDEAKTYNLIGKMLQFWSKAFRSRRIHVGMDETHDLGRGRFMDKFGYERGFDIFNRHLSKVCDICKANDLKPIIWSDMYFRMGNKTQNYYDPATVIPDDVKAKIPVEATLCYWDYYHRNEEFYIDWIRRHRELGSEPVVGSGVWTWACMWYDHEQTVATVTPCLNACRKENVKEVFFTMWGDNGGYCEYDSSLVGLAWAATLAYGGDGSNAETAPLFEAVCGGSYRDQLTASGIMYSMVKNKDIVRLLTPLIIWDDPMLGIVWNEYKFFDKDIWQHISGRMTDIYQQLAPSAGNIEAGDIDYARSICDFIVKKIALREVLLKAYQEKDTVSLDEIVKVKIPETIAALDTMTTLFRRQWLRRNKPFGLEVMQIRFAGQSARLKETALRITELQDGKINSIPEIEGYRINPEPLGQIYNTYVHNASGSQI